MAVRPRRRVTVWLMGLPLGLAVAAAVLRAADPPVVAHARLQAFDAFQRWRPRPFDDAGVRIVDIDDHSLATLGQWPWPRTLVAQLVDRLHEAGAAVIAFDIVFAEPDRTSPTQILPLWPQRPELDAVRAVITALPDHDAAFAEAISRAVVVTGFATSSSPTTAVPLRKAGIATAGDDPGPFVRMFDGVVVNLPALESASAGNGHFFIEPERDGVVRRVPLFLRVRETLYPSLMAEALRVAQGASTYVIKSSGASGAASWGEATGIVEVKIGRVIVPTDGQGRVWLYDSGPREERTIPAWRVIAGELPAGAVEGRIVFIGTSAAGLKDLRATPLASDAAGVEVHAQLAEQLITGAFLRRPDWTTGFEVVVLLALSLGLALLLPRLGAAAGALAAAAALGGVWGGAWWAFVRWGWLVDPVAPSVTVLAVYLISSLVGFLRAEAERREIRTAFSRYMSPALVRRLAEHPESLRLGGELRPMTVLFADIRGFTTISEQLDAQALTQLLNRVLTPLTQQVLDYEGTIDKYIGDCLMAFWNAPLDDAAHASHACRAALAMRDQLVSWNKDALQRASAGGPAHMPVHIGIGLNSGECCVGNMGSEQRFEYSVLGDAVNLASRLEGLSKIYAMDIIAGPVTREQARDCAWLELDVVRVKGKTQAVRVHALMGDGALAASPAFQSLAALHDRMLAAYRAQEWDRALALLEECLRLDTPTTRLRKLYTFYRDRLTRYKTAPPGEAWRGEFEVAEK